MQARARASEAVFRVAQLGRSLDGGDDAFLRLADPRDRALAREIAYGAIRWHGRLTAIAAQLLARPADELDPHVLCLLLVGLYQLEYTRIPPHACVATTLAAAELCGKGRAKGLLNAVLRRFLRERAAVLDTLTDLPDVVAHPRWLLDDLREAWPQDWEAIVAANNHKPPMVLRVNLERLSRDAYLERLHSLGIVATASAIAPAAVLLDKARPVERLPGFAEGLVSVQDAGAQLAAPAMALAPGLRVLDACAAPGGKTAHMLEIEPRLQEMVAVDVDAGRVARVRATLARLGQSATVIVADAAEPAAWWDGRPFERILLDTPCSGSGVIRRHPDIKLLRRREDVSGFARRQAALLDGVWPLLSHGGRLLYVTCSILPAENEIQMQRFLERHGDARELTLDPDLGRAGPIGRVRLPGIDGTDGFYYACLVRK